MNNGIGWIAGTFCRYSSKAVLGLVNHHIYGLNNGEATTSSALRDPLLHSHSLSIGLGRLKTGGAMAPHGPLKHLPLRPGFFFLSCGFHKIFTLQCYYQYFLSSPATFIHQCETAFLMLEVMYGSSLSTCMWRQDCLHLTSL